MLLESSCTDENPGKRGRKKLKETERGSVTVENYTIINGQDKMRGGREPLRASCEASMLISPVSRCSLIDIWINKYTRLSETGDTQKTLETRGLNHAAP